MGGAGGSASHGGSGGCSHTCSDQSQAVVAAHVRGVQRARTPSALIAAPACQHQCTLPSTAPRPTKREARARFDR
jgi:hypothetical protein